MDALDAPIELTGTDTIQIDWRSIGPVGLAAQERFVWTCGTFARTPAELATLDSIAAIVRRGGGVLCY